MLEEYLSQLQQEGKAQALDQSFSLDLAAQARKLSEFQFQNPALWILKLVQAAVASKAPEVRVTCTREILEVRFRPQWKQPIEFGPEAPTWISHLHLGLLAALSLENTALDLSWKSRSLYSRGRVPAAEGSDLRLYVQRRPRPFWHFFDRMRADIAKTLSERCALCPIPVRLDYRPVNGLLLEKCPFAAPAVKAAAMESAASSYHWLAERSWPAQAEQGRFALYPPAMRYSWQLELPQAQIPVPRRRLHPISCAHWLDLDLPLQNLPKGTSTEDLLLLAVTMDGSEVKQITAVRPEASVLTPITAPA